MSEASPPSPRDGNGAFEMKTGKAIMSDGIAIGWQREGADGAPVLMLSNSLGTTRAMWDRQAESLSAHFSILRYDTRGHGQSGVPVGAYGLDRLGRDAVELLDSLGIDKAHFCGVSLGGMTGQWLGIHAPERVDRLILANTSACMGPPAGWQSRIETVIAHGMAMIAEAVLERWFTPEFRAEAAEAIAPVRQDLLACSPIGYAGCCAAIRDMDLRPTIGLISGPALVINGLRDPATPPAQGEFIATHARNARSISLDAAHLSNIERPVAFNRAVLDFITQD